LNKLFRLRKIPKQLACPQTSPPLPLVIKKEEKQREWRRRKEDTFFPIFTHMGGGAHVNTKWK